MLTIVFVLVGIAFIVGAKEFAGKLARGVVGAILILSALPCLLQSCAYLLPGATADGVPSISGSYVFLFIAVTLAVIGLVAWRRRADRGKARELWVRRNGAPRARTLPTAPSTRNEDHR